MEISVPPENSRIWAEILNGRRQVELEFIGAKILLGRLLVKIKHGAAADTFSQGVKELREVYLRNVRLPSVQRDLAKITVH